MCQAAEHIYADAVSLALREFFRHGPPTVQQPLEVHVVSGKHKNRFLATSARHVPVQKWYDAFVLRHRFKHEKFLCFGAELLVPWIVEFRYKTSTARLFDNKSYTGVHAATDTAIQLVVGEKNVFGRHGDAAATLAMLTKTTRCKLNACEPVATRSDQFPTHLDVFNSPGHRPKACQTRYNMPGQT